MVLIESGCNLINVQIITSNIFEESIQLRKEHIQTETCLSTLERHFASLTLNDLWAFLLLFLFKIKFGNLLDDPERLSVKLLIKIDILVLFIVQ
jgi:hypothetical protein